MPFIRGKIEIDHLDPHDPDFNRGENLRVTHATCNREKGANTIAQEAKATGRTMMEIIEGGRHAASREED
jgi:hypothetical protein